MSGNDPKRFLSIRLTAGELKEVYRQFEKSTCRSLTEYVKKVLTKKPVTIKVRNQSQDDLLQAMIGIKNKLEELNELAANDSNSWLVTQQILEITVLTRKIYEKCMQ